MEEEVRNVDSVSEDISAAGNDSALTKPDYEAEILGIIRSNSSPRIMLGKIEDYHANDIAGVFSALNSQERKKLYRISNPEMLAEVFEYIDEDDAGKYLDEMDIRKAAAVVSEMETDTAANVLHQIEKEKRNVLFLIFVLTMATPTSARCRR